MIRRCLIWMVPLIFFGCTTTDKESSGSNEFDGSVEFVKKESAVFISDELHSNVSSKRRSRLSNLTSDGEAWFSLRIADSFTKIKITIANDMKPAELMWVVNGDQEDLTKNNQFALSSVDVNKGELIVDILITRKEIKVFFDEGLESYTFKHQLPSLNNRIKVSLDDENRDLPGILYDIGI
jgi:hypothetical protein